jgi:hypothetical protein
MGPVLMALWYASGHREFFRRRPEVADPAVLEDRREPAAAPAR